MVWDKERQKLVQKRSDEEALRIEVTEKERYELKNMEFDEESVNLSEDEVGDKEP